MPQVQDTTEQGFGLVEQDRHGAMIIRFQIGNHNLKYKKSTLFSSIEKINSNKIIPFAPSDIFLCTS